MTKSYIVTNAFVLNCTREQLVALACHIGMSADKQAHALKKGLTKLRATVGTLLANDPTYAPAFTAGTLSVELPVDPAEAAADQASQQQQAKASARKNVKSAKAWLRELLSTGQEYTLAELVKLSGKTEVNIRTMLSDLRSVKYAGKSGVFNTKSVRRDGTVYYSMA